MIRIAITDDETLVASSLATLLGLEEDFEIVTVCGSGEELLEWWAREPNGADVLVCDLQLGGIDGIEAAHRVREKSPGVQVLIVTSHARPTALKRALEQGVAGFLPKTSDAKEFAAAIRTVHAGRRYLDPETAALAINASDSPLTERERELLELAGRGLSIEDIAAEAHLAPGTCRNYLSNAMAKTGAGNRFEAYMVARDRGWLS
mgnify:CR=1 FL=1